MMALPVTYSLRNVGVRRSSTLLTALGIASTVAVFAGVLALREGFERIYRLAGRDDVAVYLREGATSEGESGITREAAETIVKGRPEIARSTDGRPLAAAESYLAIYMEKVGGGLTNVPLRGIEPMSIELHGEALRLIEGRWLRFGSDEVVVGRPLTRRMKRCRIGESLVLNVTPFRVVGVFEHEGVQGSEVWGDGHRMMAALQRPVYQRIVARLHPEADIEQAAATLDADPRTADIKLLSEKAYLATQTRALGGMLIFLTALLTFVMGAAAVLGAINTMLASVAARTHEIGVLLALGFSPGSIFLAFVLESGAMGLLGGLLGCLAVLPFHGYETGAMNWNTFTDVSFAFRVTPALLATAFGLAFLLGLLGGALPALHAARLKPVTAIRQG